MSPGWQPGPATPDMVEQVWGQGHRLTDGTVFYVGQRDLDHGQIVPLIYPGNVQLRPCAWCQGSPMPAMYVAAGGQVGKARALCFDHARNEHLSGASVRALNYLPG